MTAKELKDKYDADLTKLQESCKHEHIKYNLREMWAPGHYSPGTVDQCEDCWKIVRREFYGE
jgi:hypothetical protein